jgi:uncharacterized membrane protein YqjE
MAVNERNTRSPQFNRTDGFKAPEDEAEAPLGDLLRRFAQDAGALVRQEIALAKLELRENLKAYAQDAAKVGIAAAVGLLGALALTAFVIVGLGDLIDNYWLSALIVAVVLLGVAAIMVRGTLVHMRRHSIAPEETVATLKEDQQWARHEARDFKRKLKA